jgi:hypothetical protein
MVFLRERSAIKTAATQEATRKSGQFGRKAIRSDSIGTVFSLEGKMKYKPTILLCNHKGNGEPESQMEYCGNGDYVCPVCGDSYHDDDFDRGDDDSERLSAYDAALIWQSNGEDEDYMFGYTEEQLRRALE